MKFNIKHLGFCTLLGVSASMSTSCDDMLNLEPVSQITPEAFYGSADQLAAYLNSYYNGCFTTAPYSGYMYHQGSYNDGMARSDGNTDIMLVGLSGSNTLFAKDGYWEVSSGKQLQGYYGNVRAINFFLQKATEGYEAKTISGSETLVKNYIGEGYFMRAMYYFQMLAYYGDIPVITEVLEDKDDVLVENSKRTPRNEVARFILSDLDKAIELLASRDQFDGQRINKESALLFKSRVALFEATFEKYHKGSGRVPGDANWPGASMSYNSGKTFNIDSEVNFFLTEAMEAAKEVADAAVLTENNHVIQPNVGVITGWNPYFEMYSQPSLANVPEVLMWKQYNKSLNISHDAAYRVRIGCADGYTRTFAESFLCKDGLPIYASPLYKGDVSIDDVKADRDERLQLFVWGESTLKDSDPASGENQVGKNFGNPGIMDPLQETRMITGYQPRKYYTYDYTQIANDQLLGTNASPIFRSAEALLNYMEACFEKNGSLDGTAKEYWKQLRERAGVSTDLDATINATDLSKEGDFGVYSGTAMVDKTLYNIRRERMNETFSEGLRFADLIRWRSFDRLMTTQWIPEGVNFWDDMYTAYEELYPGFISDGTTDAVVSSRERGKYLQPYSINMSTANELRNGYSWHEAYYLYPLGITDIRTASPDRDLSTSNLYQNVNWPTEAGGKALK
ncbi:MAG: RagB/SusD family nutrient uptake outer membrane protein [Bacteroidaceae bacterium]|nr:RagB/SusD family nutrient uptake outer membrane protein [Bacteroidaceae bacterium]